jgi:hypothetical protein
MSRLPFIAVLGLSLSTAFVVASCEKDEPEEFGFTCVELVQADSQDTDPFGGTAKIKVTLRYEACLRDYYTKKHPEQALDGTDGPTVFAEWKERLCSESVSDPLVACEVEEFNQILLDNPPNSVFQMTITYRVLDASKVNNRTLLWGPGPVEGYAECADNQRPYARMTVQSDVIGVDKDNKTIWSASSFSNPQGIMQRNTAGCIQADITRAQGT